MSTDVEKEIEAIGALLRALEPLESKARQFRTGLCYSATRYTTAVNTGGACYHQRIIAAC